MIYPRGDPLRQRPELRPELPSEHGAGTGQPTPAEQGKGEKRL